MLKIKDNVELKELEKFGFEYWSYLYWKRYCKDNIVIFENVSDTSWDDFQEVKRVPLISRVIYTIPRTIKSDNTMWYLT